MAVLPRLVGGFFHCFVKLLSIVFVFTFEYDSRTIKLTLLKCVF